MNNRVRTVAAAGFALFCGTSVAMAQYAGPAVSTLSATAGAPASAMRIRQGKLTILPGDELGIMTYGAPELTTGGAGNAAGGLHVSDQGTVILPYVGTVKLAGMTPSAASVYLEKELKLDGILVNPQVTVQILSSPTQEITVVGEVRSPKPIPDFGVQLRLLDVIASCGGFAPLASHTIVVHRRGDPQPITVNLGVDPQATDASNIPLIPGDTVVVPQVGNAYVVGDVWRPQAIPLANNAPLTVVQAISMSGGLKYGAALSKAMILRTTADRKQVEILFDLKKMMHGKEQDIALMSNDILYVPTNAFKAALSSGYGTQASINAAAVSLGYIKP